MSTGYLLTSFIMTDAALLHGESLMRDTADPRRARSALSRWMDGAPRVSAYRRELASAIREQVDRGGDVYLGPMDAEIAADALDGFNDRDKK